MSAGGGITATAPTDDVTATAPSDDVTAPPATSRPGRHRSEAVDRVILDATLELLREHGYEALTMLSVIERSGVSSATLYRRYRTKQALVIAALESLSVDAFNCDTGDLAGDLAAFAQRSAKVFEENAPLFGRLTSELRNDEEINAALRERLLQPRIDELDGILTRARQRGELGTGREASAEDVLSMLSGPLQHRALAMGLPLTRTFVQAAVQQTADYLTAAH